MRSLEELATPRAVLVSSVLALAVSVAGGSEAGCTKLEDVCRVSEKTVVATTSPSAIAPAFARTGAATAVISFELDAPSVPSTDAGLVGSLASPTSIVPRAAEIIVLDPSFERELRRERFAVPARLAGRRGSTDNVGVAWAPGRALFHWVETTTTTAPDGALHRSMKLVLQSIELGGTEGAVLEPSEAACDDCSIQVDAVDIGGFRSILFGISPIAGASPAVQAMSSIGAFTLRPNGELVTRAVPFTGSGFPRFEVENGVLVLAGERSLVPIDASLDVVGPTLTSPMMNTARANLDLHGDSFIAYVGLAQASSALSSRESELMVQRYDRAGHASAPLEHLATTTASVRALARRDEDLLLMHGGSPRMLSLARIPSAANEPPHKVGGDIVFDAAPAYDQRMIALGPHQFRAASIEDGHVVRREVSCAPEQ